MFKNGMTRLAALALGAFALMAGSASAVVVTYDATHIPGDQAPPNYGMRLDGFFGGGGSERVTFSFIGVQLDIDDNNTALDLTDDTARLYGQVQVVEVSGSAPSASQNRTYNLDVQFVSDVAPGSNSNFQYFTILPTAGQMVNVADPNDYVVMTSKSDGNSEFQVGFEANRKNDNFGAAGWIMATHYDGDNEYGTVPSSDFLMDLTLDTTPEEPVVPEPATLALLGLGLGSAGLLRRRRS